MEKTIFLFAEGYLKTKQAARNCQLWNWMALAFLLASLASMSMPIFKSSHITVTSGNVSKALTLHCMQMM